MILGTGVDVIEVARVQRAAEKEAFLRRVFTAGERAFFAQRNNSPHTMAGTFAAKEAVSKALGTGFSEGLGLQDIEICHLESGAPYASLTGAAKARLESMGGTRVHVSISHIKTVAVAQAVIEDG